MVSFLLWWSHGNIIHMNHPDGISNCVICLETSAGLRGEARWASGCLREVRRRAGTRFETNHNRLFLTPAPQESEELRRDRWAGGRGRLGSYHLPPRAHKKAFLLAIYTCQPTGTPGESARWRHLTLHHSLPHRGAKAPADEQEVIQRGFLCWEQVWKAARTAIKCKNAAWRAREPIRKAGFNQKQKHWPRWHRSRETQCRGRHGNLLPFSDNIASFRGGERTSWKSQKKVTAGLHPTRWIFPP